MARSKPKAVVLLSGGLDSATALAIAQRDGFDVHALSFLYGQRHMYELVAAREVAVAAGVVDHQEHRIDLRVFGGSALTADIEVPTGPDSPGIPITYVPARNTIFLSYALAWAEVLEANDIFIGVNAVDYSGYPDCRPEYIAAYEKMANLATKRAVEGQALTIHTPLIAHTKAEIISLGVGLGVPFGITRSCYDPTLGGEGCGICDSCRIRLAGFAANGWPDPAPYKDDGAP